MIEYRNYYATEARLEAPPENGELSLGAMYDWLSEIRHSTLQGAVSQLIVKLDHMSRIAMSAAERRKLLRELQRPVLKAANALPKTPGGGRERGRRFASPLSMEQRLYCLMVKNLKQILQDLDATLDAPSTRVGRRRRWTVQKLFLYLGRQIELSLCWGLPLPSRTWLELHELHKYAAVRGMGPFTGGDWRTVDGENFDPDREYKRLLLLGLAGRLVQHSPWSDFVREKIDFWVKDTSLELPDAFCGRVDLYVVETAKDSPPRQLRGALPKSFQGWVLMRPSGFLSDVAALPPKTRTSALVTQGQNSGRGGQGMARKGETGTATIISLPLG